MASILNHIQRELIQKNLKFDPWQIAAFYTALQVKGFVILSGISGTGKTKLAQRFAGLLPQPIQGEISTSPAASQSEAAEYGPNLRGANKFISGGGRINLDYSLVSKYFPSSMHTTEHKPFNIIVEVNSNESEGSFTYIETGHIARIHLLGKNEEVYELLKKLDEDDHQLVVEPRLTKGQLYNDIEGRPHLRLRRKDHTPSSSADASNVVANNEPLPSQSVALPMSQQTYGTPIKKKLTGSMINGETLIYASSHFYSLVGDDYSDTRKPVDIEIDGKVVVGGAKFKCKPPPAMSELYLSQKKDAYKWLSALQEGSILILRTRQVDGEFAGFTVSTATDEQAKSAVTNQSEPSVLILASTEAQQASEGADPSATNIDDKESSAGGQKDDEDNKPANYLFYSVRPDWRDSKALLGYYNPIEQRYIRTEFLSLIEKATEDYQKNKEKALAYFVVLDEMNLAHVEYYFADMLSVLESGRRSDGMTTEVLHLYDPKAIPNTIKPDVTAELRLPPNLYVIGTVNMDETTYAFSPKVLDRAFTLEFTHVDFATYPPLPKNGSDSSGLAVESVEMSAEQLLQEFAKNGKFVSWAALWKNEKDEMAYYVQKYNDLREQLIRLNKLLTQHNMQFGYRVFDEIFAFLKLAEENHTFAEALEVERKPSANEVHSSSTLMPDDTNTVLVGAEGGVTEDTPPSAPLATPTPVYDVKEYAFDAALLMKVLPKFRGSRSRLQLPLCVLLLWADEPSSTTIATGAKKLNSDLNTADDDGFDKSINRTFVYQKLGERVQRMLRELRSDGFTSFG